MREREPAICLRANDYSETSQVLHFITRGAGAVRLLAKGSKRARSATGGAVDLLSEGDLVFIPSRSQGLGTLVEFAETVSHAGLRRDAGRLGRAMLMVELVGEFFAEDDPHPEVFDLLHHALGRLGESDAPGPAVLAYFQWRLLHHAGLLGDLGHCVACGQPIALAAGGKSPRVFFSSMEGGLVCGDCEGALAEKVRVDAETLSGLVALADARAGKGGALTDSQAHGVCRTLAYHASQQLGKPLKTARLAIPPR